MNDVVLNFSSPLQAEVSWDGVVATVTVTGELDITNATHLTRSFLAVLVGHPERLVLDLSELVFVDVAGARALDEVHTLRQSECPVIVRQPRPSARKVFEITGLMGGLGRFCCHGCDQQCDQASRGTPGRERACPRTHRLSEPPPPTRIPAAEAGRTAPMR